MVTVSRARTGRADTTRELILSTAERLFAEHGLFAVSNRGISVAAGQGNNTAVGYHFGTKTDLVRAIVRTHTDRLEPLWARAVEEAGDPAGTGDWIACLVRPVTRHLAHLGVPSWFARFSAQVMTDPGLRVIMTEETLTSPPLRRVLLGLRASLPDLPPPVRAEREDMTRHLIVHMCAERERALAEETATPRCSWEDTATGLVDALTGIWLAPVTPAEGRDRAAKTKEEERP
ncbi:TetR/AcrR family transcriptional regulator [Nocardiopsis dassonvillei]|uniref:TetR/AcrR family transcriptional regulator n=1 Tax=Nocardiopsis dassonvillei TaxID=2014 RepID=UPI00200F90AA|nr:TetR/AcrR family transcriptional regulator [Nocardiopsis dassonvillei]MCK9870360.1 TetR/AcrR family transcriptional regulator [Nocardiopsis dassonvillei]